MLWRQLFDVLIGTAFALVLMLVGCEGDAIEAEVFRFTFDNDAEGWVAGSSDYPLGVSAAEQQAIDDFYEIESGHSPLPEPLDPADGAFRLSGNNHSDDLFMFLKRQISGLKPDTTYRLELRAEIATNVPKGCFGVDGSPGESVYVKGGGAVIQPVRVPDPGNPQRWVMNIDKGEQANGGADAQVLGDFANSKDCDSGDFSYELKSLSNLALPAFHVTTDNDGNSWLLFGTDSGFEATTTIYYTEIEAMFVEAANGPD